MDSMVSRAAEATDSAVSLNHRSMTPSMIMVSLPGKIARVCNIDPSQDLGPYRDYLSDICTQCAIVRGG